MLASCLRESRSSLVIQSNEWSDESRQCELTRISVCSQWSQEVSIRTLHAECGDTELRDAFRSALNTHEYADKVAAQLYHEQWSLSSLKAISSSRLEELFRNMRVPSFLT